MTDTARLRLAFARETGFPRDLHPLEGMDLPVPRALAPDPHPRVPPR
jgi:hypothetical protein